MRSNLGFDDLDVTGQVELSDIPVDYSENDRIMNVELPRLSAALGRRDVRHDGDLQPDQSRTALRDLMHTDTMNQSMNNDEEHAAGPHGECKRPP
ncbi:hypothetical protein [Stieleria varia]|uniref:hypothetical protein n=1 Tax=Stieleria varia TaxID=2528005 RepID=UPI0011B4BBDE|nr:hypothetical protein [Stieleria varia]